MLVQNIKILGAKDAIVLFNLESDGIFENTSANAPLATNFFRCLIAITPQSKGGLLVRLRNRLFHCTFFKKSNTTNRRTVISRLSRRDVVCYERGTEQIYWP